MKILFVTMQLGPGYTQGTERYVTTLGEALRERGHHVSYLAGDPLGYHGHRGFGCPLREDPRILHYPSYGWMSVLGLAPARLERWLSANRPDVVHVANPAHVGAGIMLACRRLDVPCVVTTMDFWWVCPKATLLRDDRTICDGTPGWKECTRCMAGDHPWGLVQRLGGLPRVASPFTASLYFGRAAVRGMSVADMGRWPRRRAVLLGCLDRADAVIFPSKATQAAIRPRLSHHRSRLIPYGLTQEWFEEPRPAAPQPVEPDALTIGFAGALRPHKGPHLLLAAVKQLGWCRARIRLAGPSDDPDYRRQLEAAARDLNVDFVGQLTRDQMPAFLRGLDILAVTSIWPENLPFIMLEAQAAGTVVVAGGVSGVAEQVSDARLLFEPGSVSGLAEALVYAREHPEAGHSARVPAAAEMTDATLAVYRDAMIVRPS